jgi:hypothetical protein
MNMSALTSVSTIQTLFITVCTEFSVHESDTVSYEHVCIDSVSAIQTLFLMLITALSSVCITRHCFRTHMDCHNSLPNKRL